MSSTMLFEACRYTEGLRPGDVGGGIRGVPSSSPTGECCIAPSASAVDSRIVSVPGTWEELCLDGTDLLLKKSLSLGVVGAGVAWRSLST